MLAGRYCVWHFEKSASLVSAKWLAAVRMFVSPCLMLK